MEIGDIIKTPSIADTYYDENGKISSVLTYSSGKKENFVFLYLGTEDRGVDNVDGYIKIIEELHQLIQETKKDD